MNNMKNCNEKGVEPLDYKLLQGRTVLVFGALTDEVVHKTVSSLLYLQEQDPCTPVKMYINSEGGNETEGLAIFDVMRNLSCPVHTICVGKAHGAAALLLAG
ncbi:MAG: ATP-dependent Clp protease proteolytic subunit [Clostridia bacterium]|nr:ATP-dependent Clp protease proteolytic subunit [Clostridia bacterium]